MTDEVGAIVEGTVVEIVKYGAFVKIRGGKTGLVHISQISDEFVREVSDHVSIGSQVVAKIISVDDKGRVQLSLKDVTEEESSQFVERETAGEPRLRQKDRGVSQGYQAQPARKEEREEDSFEKKLKRFMRQSEDRLIDVKRSIESKRGIKRRKK